MSLVAQFEAAIQRRIEATMIIAGEIVATEIRRSIQQSPRGGKTYVKTNPNRTHKASAPGEAPATDLGFLVRSIQTEPDLPNLRIRILSLHSIAPYAKSLEYGDLSRGLQQDLLCVRAYRPKRNRL